jgi:hypothetical protein
MRRLRDAPTASITREHRVRRERAGFQGFEIFSRAQHRDE